MTAAGYFDREVVWRLPGGIRGLVSRMGIGHVLVAQVDGHEWRVDLGGLPRERPTQLLVDGTPVGTFDAWPRTWIDTVHLQHLERAMPDRRIDTRPPIDIAASVFGPTLVVVDEAGVVVHDLELRLARTMCILGAQARVHAVAVDPTGARVAAAFGHYVVDPSGDESLSGWVDGTVRVFRVVDGAQEAAAAPEANRVHAVAFTADGDRVVSACGNAVRVHRTWDEILETTLVRSAEDDVAFAPNGTVFVTLESGREIALWERRDGVARRIVVLGEHPNAHALAFGRAGALLATANDVDVRIWNLRALALDRTFARPADTTALAFTPAGDALLCAGWSDPDPYRRKPLLQLVDIRDGHTLVELHGHIDAPNALAIDPRGAFAASASFEGPVRLWRLADGSCMRMFDAKALPPARLAFARGGAELVLLSDQLWRWRCDDGAMLERIRTRSGAPYGGDVAQRKDGTYVGVTRAGAFVELPDDAVVPARNRGMLDLTADGSLVARTVENGDLAVTQTKDGREIALLAPSSTGATVLATSPDGIHYATGDGAAARLYRLGVTEPIAVYPSPRVTALAMGGERGSWLAIGREDGTIEVRDCQNGSLLASLDLRAGHVRSLAFRGDARVLAVATARAVRLIATGGWSDITGWGDDVLVDPLRVAWAEGRLVIADKRGCLVFEYPDAQVWTARPDRPEPSRPR